MRNVLLLSEFLGDLVFWVYMFITKCMYTHTHRRGLRTQFGKFSAVDDLIDHCESKHVIGGESLVRL